MKFQVIFTTFERVVGVICPCKCRGCGRVGEAWCERCKFYNTLYNPGFVEKMGEGDSGGVLMVGGVKDGAVARMITEYKYQAARELARPLAEIMAEVVKGWVGLSGGGENGDEGSGASEERGGEAREVCESGMGEVCESGADKRCEGEIIIVPLPTIARHIRERGFDHMRRLGEELGKIMGWRCVSLLKRVNATVQVGVDAEMRKRQAAEAYAVDEKVLKRMQRRGRARVNRGRVEGVEVGVKARMDELEGLTILLIDDVCTTGASLEAAEKVLREAGFKKIHRAVVAKSSVYDDMD